MENAGGCPSLPIPILRRIAWAASSTVSQFVSTFWRLEYFLHGDFQSVGAEWKSLPFSSLGRVVWVVEFSLSSVSRRFSSKQKEFILLMKMQVENPPFLILREIVSMFPNSERDSVVFPNSERDSVSVSQFRERLWHNLCGCFWSVAAKNLAVVYYMASFVYLCNFQIKQTFSFLSGARMGFIIGLLEHLTTIDYIFCTTIFGF